MSVVALDKAEAALCCTRIRSVSCMALVWLETPNPQLYPLSAI
jgi:hypothetical protein